MSDFFKLESIIKCLPNGARVGDFGSGSQFLRNLCERLNPSIDYVAVDRKKDTGVIAVDFDKEPLPFKDEHFDLVVSSHVLEHLHKPIDHLSELIRVSKVGGKIYIETPSERSLSALSHIGDYRKGLILNYYDDPTHVGRPWSGQSLFRIGVYFDLKIINIKYDISFIDRILLPLYYLKWLVDGDSIFYVKKAWKANGWVVRAIYERKNNGDVVFNYFSFKDKKNGHFE